MGRIDADGYLWFVDRRADLIKSGGENIASAEIERVIAQHPDVAEVAVIGVPDPQWDEVPKAFVILRPGATAPPRNARALPGRSSPVQGAQVRRARESLPRNDSGKVLKKALREAAVVRVSTANIAAMLAGNARRFADADALVFEDRRWTHRQLDDDVNALAAGLTTEGVRHDSRVAIVANNVPEFLILSLALAKLGAVFVPLNYRLTAGELAQPAGARAGRGGRRPCRSSPRSPPPRSPTCRTSVGSRWSRSTTAGPTCGRSSRRTGARGSPTPSSTTTALQRIIYTSGTTSLPKGVMLTHGNVNRNMHAQIVELGLRPTDRILNFAPLYHVGGTDLPGYGIWHVGGCMVLHRRFVPAAVLRAIEAERITGMVHGGHDARHGPPRGDHRRCRPVVGTLADLLAGHLGAVRGGPGAVPVRPADRGVRPHRDL